MEIATSLKKIDYIYHLADIHFPKDISTDEYKKERYQTLIENILTDAGTVRNCIAVITGDLLKNNDQGTPDLIKMCIQFLNALGELMPVFVIAGNHDYNHTTHKTWFDIFDAVVTTNVHILTKSGFYIVTSKTTRILIGFQSITDNYYSFFFNNQNVCTVRESYKCKRAIALFHGNIVGGKISNNKKWSYDESIYDINTYNYDYNLNKQWMKEYDLVLLGHIHIRQKLDPNFYYAGSTLQQNYSESVDEHGGFLFNVNTLKRRVINYRDLYANYVLNEIDAKLHVQLPYPDRKYFLKIHYTDSLNRHDRDEIENYYNNTYTIIKFDWHYNITTTTKQLKILPMSSVFDSVIQNYSQDVQMRLKQMESIKLPSANISSCGFSIQIQDIQWQNIFCYGSSTSVLNLNDSVTIISAPNTLGKSTIWRIILVALYADIDQRGIVSRLLDNIVNKYANQGWIKMRCKINNNQCLIIREFKQSNTRCTHNYKIIVNGIEKDKTWLKTNLIPYDVLVSNFSITKDSESIYDKTVGKLQKYINDTFNIESISTQLQETTVKLTELNNKLINLNSQKEIAEESIKEFENVDITSIDNSIKELQIKLNQLQKPVNKFATYSSQNVINGDYLDVFPNITENNYLQLTNFYKSHKIIKEIIELYANISGLMEEDMIQLFDQVTLSDKVKTYIQHKDIDMLSKILNISSENNELINTCWNEIQKYKQYVKPSTNHLPTVTIVDCFNYLFKSTIIIPAKYAENIDESDFIKGEMIIYEMKEHELIDPNNSIITTTQMDQHDYINMVYEIYKMLDNIGCTINTEQCIQNTYNVTEKSIEALSNKLKHMNMFLWKNENNKQLRKDLLTINNLISQEYDYTKLTKSEVITQLKMCVNIIAKIKQDDRYVNLIRDANINISIEYFNTIYTDCVKILCKYNQFALIQNARLRNYHINMINIYYNYLLSQKEKDISIIKAASSYICDDMVYHQFDTMIQNIYNWTTNILHTITVNYNIYETQLNEYTNNSVQITKKLTELEFKQADYHKNMHKFDTLIKSLTKEILSVTNEIDVYKKYKISIENTRAKVIQDGLKNIETHINNELTTYVQYYINIEQKDSINKSSQYTIIIFNRNTNQKIMYDNLSGYEKAIIQFVTMHVINSFSSNYFNLFYIDEAFDVFDENNFNMYIPNLLQIAAGYTQNVLFVTHRNIPTMNIDYKLKTIERSGNTSILQ